MLSGYNTNVKHRGVLFHVQTEDSGVRNPHVITHLYHQGTILASEKSEYRHLLEDSDREGAVKAQMEGQHKEMLKRLRRGVFDELIAERLGPAAAADATGSTTQQETPPVTPAPTSASGEGEAVRPFGQGIVSQKPLDEVVLEYLVDSARKRKKRP
jgi:hypothetical protein